MTVVQSPGSRGGIVRPPRQSLPYTRKQLLSVALMMVGACLLGYVGSEYWYMYHTQRVLEAEWERQGAAASAPGASAAQALTRISIPKISLEAMVVEGATSQQLTEGPGHLTETAFPGDAGNAVITGHRDTFFRRIFELDQGDEINVQRNGRVFRYQVTGKKIVKPDDVSVLNPTNDAQLTLITCYPMHYIGPAPKRLVIFSKLAP
jgi:LPXTG-site transpeptidase (sortase) family protein